MGQNANLTLGVRGVTQIMVDECGPMLAPLDRHTSIQLYGKVYSLLRIRNAVSQNTFEA
jgi:hypothetical protein